MIRNPLADVRPVQRGAGLVSLDEALADVLAYSANVVGYSDDSFDAHKSRVRLGHALADVAAAHLRAASTPDEVGAARDELQAALDNVDRAETGTAGRAYSSVPDDVLEECAHGPAAARVDDVLRIHALRELALRRRGF